MKSLRMLALLAAIASGSPAHAGEAPVDTSSLTSITDAHGQVHGLGLLHREGDGPRNGVLYWSPNTHAKAAPAEYDLRTLGFVSSIKNQGQCGSCWAFSVTKALESALMRAGRGELDLSEQQIVSCDGNAYGCGGGMMDDMDYVVKIPLPLEKDYRYTGSNSRCKSPLPAPAKTADGQLAQGIRWGYVGKQGQQPTMNEIKQALVDYGVLSVTVAAGGNDWSNGGDMNGCNVRGVNHMVDLVGYKTVNGKEKLIGVNSWGADWGESGFFYAKQGCDELASGSESVSFVVVDGGPSPLPPHVVLPAEVDVFPGTEVMLGVRPEAGVSYSWTAGGKATPDTDSMIYVTPEADTVYQLTAKTAAGTAQSSVKVHVLPAPNH